MYFTSLEFKIERIKDRKPEFRRVNVRNKIMQIQCGLFRFVLTEIKALGFRVLWTSHNEIDFPGLFYLSACLDFVHKPWISYMISVHSFCLLSACCIYFHLHS